MYNNLKIPNVESVNRTAILIVGMLWYYCMYCVAGEGEVIEVCLSHCEFTGCMCEEVALPSCPLICGHHHHWLGCIIALIVSGVVIFPFPI